MIGNDITFPPGPGQRVPGIVVRDRPGQFYDALPEALRSQISPPPPPPLASSHLQSRRTLRRWWVSSLLHCCIAFSLECRSCCHALRLFRCLRLLFFLANPASRHACVAARIPMTSTRRDPHACQSFRRFLLPFWRPKQQPVAFSAIGPLHVASCGSAHFTPCDRRFSGALGWLLFLTPAFSAPSGFSCSSAQRCSSCSSAFFDDTEIPTSPSYFPPRPRDPAHPPS